MQKILKVICSIWALMAASGCFIGTNSYVRVFDVSKGSLDVPASKLEAITTLEQLHGKIGYDYQVVQNLRSSYSAIMISGTHQQEENPVHVIVNWRSTTSSWQVVINKNGSLEDERTKYLCGIIRSTLEGAVRGRWNESFFTNSIPP